MTKTFEVDRVKVRTGSHRRYIVVATVRYENPDIEPRSAIVYRTDDPGRATARVNKEGRNREYRTSGISPTKGAYIRRAHAIDTRTGLEL